MKYQREGQENTNTEPLIKYDPWYLKQGWAGRLKAFEIVSTFLAAVVLPTDETSTRYTFFRVVAWIAFSFAVIDMILHLTSLWEKVHPIFKASEALMTFAAMTAFLLLVASGLLANLAPRSQHFGRNTTALTAGFFASAFYAIEALLHFLRFRSEDPPFPQTTMASDFSAVM
eukprot:gene13508-4388_t